MSKHRGTKRGLYFSRKLTAESAPPVPPPDSGALPWSDGTLVQGEAPYWVQFFDNLGNNSYFTGAIIGTHWVLTSATVASTVTTSWTVKYGGVMADASDCSSAAVSGTSFHPSWVTPGDGHDIGLIYVGAGLSLSANAQVIPYSAAVGTSPYDGEYFYPDVGGIIMAEQGTLYYVGGAFDSAMTQLEGRVKPTITQADATSIFGSIDAGSIAINTESKIFTNLGSPLVCAGYTGIYPGYFLIGPCSQLDNPSYLAQKYTRCSHNGGWIYGETGIDAIIYP